MSLSRAQAYEALREAIIAVIRAEEEEGELSDDGPRLVTHYAVVVAEAGATQGDTPILPLGPPEQAEWMTAALLREATVAIDQSSLLGVLGELLSGSDE